MVCEVRHIDRLAYVPFPLFTIKKCSMAVFSTQIVQRYRRGTAVTAVLEKPHHRHEFVQHSGPQRRRERESEAVRLCVFIQSGRLPLLSISSNGYHTIIIGTCSSDSPMLQLQEHETGWGVKAPPMAPTTGGVRAGRQVRPGHRLFLLCSALCVRCWRCPCLRDLWCSVAATEWKVVEYVYTYHMYVCI